MDAHALTATAVERARAASPRLATLPITLVALAIWTWAVDGVDIERVTDAGIVSVLPPETWLAYALVVAAFWVTLFSAPIRQWLLGVHLIALILMIYALPALTEDVPRMAAAWRHVGVIEYVTRTGSVDPGIDAYFNWPGFFVLAGFVTELGGLRSAEVFLQWAPPINALLYLPPLLVILRTATSDVRVVWGAAWIFYSMNWIGQDYFSPQAFAYFFYLVVLAIILRWFVQPEAFGRRWGRILKRRSPPGHVDESTTATTRIALMAVVIILLLASVPTHQLTPFALLVSLTALTLLGLTRAPNLPLLLVVALGAWLSFMAIAYVSGHLDRVVGGFGALGDTADANVGSRLKGSSDHLLIVRLRLVLTGFVWLLAVVGAVRAARGGRLWPPVAVLALAPFALVAVQPYGGEVLLRVYFFTLPFMALLIASLIQGPAWSVRGGSALAVVGEAALAVVAFLLLAASLAARYGNERMEHFTSDELGAIQHLYDVAPRGSTFVTWGRNIPWKFKEYEQFKYREVTDADVWKGNETPHQALDRIEALTASAGQRPAYVVFTRSQEAENDIRSLAPPGRLERVEALVAASTAFQLVYESRDAAIFKRTGGAS